MSNNSLLVIGGGFSGISAALEAAELGFEVFLVEKTPYLGGRVMQLNKYFPKICPPSCGLEIQYQRIKNNPNVKFFTQAEVTSLSGSVGNMTAKVKIKPRHTAPSSVDYSLYADGLKSKTESEFELGMGKRKALHMDAPFAFPNRWVLEADELNDADKKSLASAPGIDLSEQEKEISLNVGAVVVATGWQPYDINNLDNLGGGTIQNVVSNMQFERIASPHGPTEGKIVRPSDGKEAKRVCFVQCAGSRDENHLSDGSYICCRAM
jgi:quinone-modifying oxidoreductase subunit QmoA